jgi:hypothetical protein
MSQRLAQSARQRAFFGAGAGQNAARGGSVAGRKPLRVDAQSPEHPVPSAWTVALQRSVAREVATGNLTPRAVALAMLLALALGALTVGVASLLGAAS